MRGGAWALLATLVAASVACDGRRVEEASGQSASVGSALAPPWLLATHGKGTWVTANAAVLGAWVDARVANVRYDKRVFDEVRAPYEGGAEIRTLAPAFFRGANADGSERWGTDALEIYPRGGPHGARPDGPVAFRLRMQHDADHDGVDAMEVTAWEPLDELKRSRTA